MKKKIIAIGLIFSLIVTPVLTGCANSDNFSDSTEATLGSKLRNSSDDSSYEYFSECPGLPTPSSAVSSIDFDALKGEMYHYTYATDDDWLAYCEVLVRLGYWLEKDEEGIIEGQLLPFIIQDPDGNDVGNVYIGNDEVGYRMLVTFS
ncbi:MAG: hypothetical protein U0L18_05800 [Acutalibacteraceae bacterium]|nr:hypothetical protein [Acutalibacteraceae bacterium]